MVPRSSYDSSSSASTSLVVVLVVVYHSNNSRILRYKLIESLPRAPGLKKLASWSKNEIHQISKTK